MRLETRDRQVLAEAFASRVIRRDDLIHLGLFSSVVRCNARLHQLKEAGLIAAREELCGLKLRSPFYICTAKGMHVAASGLGLSPTEAVEIHRSNKREATIRHCLRCNDLRTRFISELSGDKATRLIRWWPELLCRHEFQDRLGQTVVIKPDALAVLLHQSREQQLFIEVDLGNVSLPKFVDKVRRYERYAASGAFADAYGAETFHVLTVTTDEHRLVNLSSQCSGRRYIFTTWRRLSQSNLNDRVFTQESKSRLLSEFLDGVGR